MKTLINHLLHNNIDKIVSKSLLNCHCPGLHSIMLLESPGKTIRLYISEPKNQMWKNFPEYYSDNSMSVAFHPHHCNLTLQCVKGRFLNWELKESSAGIYIQKFKYQSKITKGKLKFKSEGYSYLATTDYRWVNEGDSISMPAHQIHTVACEYDKWSAWLVYEGTEDKNYSSSCWSNSNPNEQVFENLYLKPTKQQIVNLLQEVGLLNN